MTFLTTILVYCLQVDKTINTNHKAWQRQKCGNEFLRQVYNVPDVPSLFSNERRQLAAVITDGLKISRHKCKRMIVTNDTTRVNRTEKLFIFQGSNPKQHACRWLWDISGGSRAWEKSTYIWRKREHLFYSEMRAENERIMARANRNSGDFSRRRCFVGTREDWTY